MSGQPRHTPERAARWLRVSTGGQDEANQEPSEDRWIAGHGYAHVKDYVLHGKSAYKGQQDAKLDEVIADMQDGAVDVLIVWQSSRIERRGIYNVFDLARRVQQAGGRIEYTEDSYLNESNEMSGALLAMVASKDNMDSRDRSKKTLMTHERIRTNGGFLGRPPYGWRVAPNGEKYSKRAVQCEPETDTLRVAVDRYLNRGESLRVICDDFNADPDKYPGPTFKGHRSKWYPNTLSDLFRNPATAGRFMWTFYGEQIKLAEYKGIITWPEHEQLVARLNSRAHRAGISPVNVFLLTGMLADEAGHPMYGKRGKTKGSLYSYYYCRKPGCGTSLPLAEVDATVSASVYELFGEERHQIRKLIPGENYYDQIARKRQDIRELDPEADDYDARLTALRAELAELRSRPSKPDHVEWVDSGKTISQHWAGLNTAGRHDWLKANGYQITACRDAEYWSLRIETGSDLTAQAESLGALPLGEYVRRINAVADALKK